jgi:SAM-dependent methyltransferase
MISESSARLEVLKTEIRNASPLPPQETEELICKYFSSPFAITSLLQSKYNFADLKVLDIGSAYGQHLFYWGRNSEGIEAQQRAASFTTALGFQTHCLNVEDDLSVLPPESFEAIHTNNLIEHLVSPHLFLARCYQLLKEDGILAIGHPVVPPALSKWLWQAIGITGWLAVEHINFYTPATAKLTLERAGFEVVEQVAPGFLRLHPRVAQTVLPISVSCYSICRKRKRYSYPAKRLEEFDPSFFGEELSVFRNPQQ